MPCILIVDDEPDHNDFLAAYLRRQGFTTRCAPNGREALSQLLNNSVDGVILDVRMPEMSGLDLLEIIRSYLRWHTLPVVLVTAHGTPQELDRARELGVSCIFQKAAFRLVDLLECLEREMPPAAEAGDGA